MGRELKDIPTLELYNKIKKRDGVEVFELPKGSEGFVCYEDFETILKVNNQAIRR